MILTQDLCQLYNSMLTALTRQQVTLRVDIARVMAAAATRGYALKKWGTGLFFYINLSRSPSCMPYELPRKCERHSCVRWHSSLLRAACRWETYRL